MECEKLFLEIDKLNDKYIKVWEDVCNIESPTAFKEGVDAVGKYFADMGKDLGFEVEVYPQEKSGDVVTLKMNTSSTEKPIIFSAHTDTVHPVGLFGTPAVRFDEEKIYGPGVTDCKGGGVAALMAMEALKNVGFEERPVWLILQSDEEVGSMQSNKDTINYICEISKDAIGFINTEPAHEGTAMLGTKGILRYDVEILGRAAHSSVCMNGANAVAEAAYKIIELEKIKNLDGVTCNCGVISGGTVPNSVAEKCTFSADFRFVSNAGISEAKEKMKEVAETVYVEGCKCTLTEKGNRPAMEYSEKNEKFFQIANEIYESNNLPVLTARKSAGGTDAAYVTLAGIPCFDGMGVQGGKIHSRDEFGYLSSLALSAKQMASVAYCIK